MIVALGTPARFAVYSCVRERYIDQYRLQTVDPVYLPAFLLDDTLALATDIGCTIGDVLAWHEKATA